MGRKHLGGLAVGAAIVIAVTTAQAATAEEFPTLTPLGGIPTLVEYCQSLGYDGALLQKGIVVGRGAAFNNWRCYSSNSALGTRAFDMAAACRWYYHLNNVVAYPLDPNDAFTWVCYTPTR
jgi:hypothetical protein